jgi:hypothetical protein
LKAPSNKILILSAVCLSVIACLGAYKIGEARKVINDASKTNSAVYIDIQKTNADNADLQQALQQIQLDETLNASGTDDNPFAPLPTDTMTDSLAKDIFLTYAQRESGQINDDDDTIANNIVGSIKVSDMPQPAYNLGNMKLFVPITTEEAKKYGNQAGQIIRDYYAVLKLPQYADNDLRKVAIVHKAIGAELIKLQVPAAISQSHLNLANAYVMFGESLMLLASQEEKDPLKALLSVSTAKDSSAAIAKSAGEINSYFEQNAILYAENEGGAIWPRLLSNEQ